ncbi:MAG: ACT domain-containing protein [Actinobacteria bacterium]|nr:ACT domain-containing protein [Actinomycetota bacterium]
MSTYAVTAVGPDAPGEVAALAEALERLGANLEDASMTRLRGHFAMTLIASLPAPANEVEAALQGLAGLHVSVWPVGDHPVPPLGGRPWRVTLHGADRPGLVAGAARAIAEAGGNITDLSCRLIGDLYVMTIEVDVTGELDLEDVGTRLGVTVHAEPVDEDVL